MWAHLLLQLLVRIVDAELFKAVLLEVFEPVNVLSEWANLKKKNVSNAV